VTVTVAEPVLVGSAVLVAVIVYDATVDEPKVAVKPLAVSVPPVGVALHVTPVEQLAVALTVAVSDTVAPAFTEAGFALTLTLLTVQGGVPGALLLPHAACTSADIAAAAEIRFVRRITPIITVVEGQWCSPTAASLPSNAPRSNPMSDG
jgi:hypothetical protein